MASLATRIKRLEQLVALSRPCVDDELLRVAGKTQAQAIADNLEWQRQMVASSDLSTAEREPYLQRIAEYEEQFADELRGEHADKSVSRYSPNRDPQLAG